MKKGMALALALLMVLLCGSAMGAAQRAYTFPVPILNPERAREFVVKSYENTLGREADEGGLNGWVDLLLSGNTTPAGVIMGLATSDEMTSRGLSDEDFIRVMYQAFMQRDADPDGFAGWMGLMNSGVTRLSVMEGFASSDEFLKIAASLTGSYWEEYPLCPLKRMKNIKSNVTASTMYRDDDTGKATLGSLIYTEVNRYYQDRNMGGIGVALDLYSDRYVYVGLDRDNYGFVALPTILDDYRVFCWQENNIMNWGSFSDQEITVLLRQMKEWDALNNAYFSGALMAVEAWLDN